MIHVFIDADNQSCKLAPFIFHYIQSTYRNKREDIFCWVAGNSDGKRLELWVDSLKEITLLNENIVVKKMPSIEDAADIQIIMWMSSIVEKNKKNSAITKDRIVIVSRDGLLIRTGHIINDLYKMDVSVIVSDNHFEIPKDKHSIPIILMPVRDNDEFYNRKLASVVDRFNSIEQNACATSPPLVAS